MADASTRRTPAHLGKTIEEYKFVLQYMAENKLSFGGAVDDLGLNRTVMYKLRERILGGNFDYVKHSMAKEDGRELLKLSEWSKSVEFRKPRKDTPVVAAKPPKTLIEEKPVNETPNTQPVEPTAPVVTSTPTPTVAAVERPATPASQPPRLKVKSRDVEPTPPRYEKPAPQLICLIGAADEIAAALMKMRG